MMPQVIISLQWNPEQNQNLNPRLLNLNHLLLQKPKGVDRV